MWHDLLIVMSSVIGGFVPDRIYCVVVTDDVTEVVNELIESNRTIQRELNEAQSRIHEQSMELESADRRARPIR